MKRTILWFMLVPMGMVAIFGLTVIATDTAPVDVVITITAEEAQAVNWMLAQPVAGGVGRGGRGGRGLEAGPNLVTPSDALRYLINPPLHQLVERYKSTVDAETDPSRRAIYDRIKGLSAAECLAFAKTYGIAVAALPCRG